jgi:hypothetical protein
MQQYFIKFSYGILSDSSKNLIDSIIFLVNKDYCIDKNGDGYMSAILSEEDIKEQCIFKVKSKYKNLPAYATKIIYVQFGKIISITKL